MVLIANKKSKNQMKEDLSLFVGDYVGEFVDWLHYCLDEIKLGKDPFLKSIDKTEERTNLKEEESTSLSNSKANNSITSSSKSNKSSNEDFKENTKQKSTRKEILFKDEITNKETNVERQQTAPSTITEDRPKRAHKLIVFDGEEDQNNLASTKKFKDQTIETTPKSTIIPTAKQQPTSSSTRTISTRSVSIRSVPSGLVSKQENNKYHHALDKPSSSIKRNSQINYDDSNSKNSNYKKSFATVSESTDHANNHYDIQKNEIKQQQQSINNNSIKKKPELIAVKSKSSLIFKAMADANKSSNLTLISLRKQDSSKNSLINRLGNNSTVEQSQTESKEISSNSTRTIKIKENEDVRKEKRLIKYKQEQAKLEVKKQVEANKTENELKIIENKNLDLDDLRHRLSSSLKRKSPDESVGHLPKRNQNKKIINLISNQIKSNDKELRNDKLQVADEVKKKEDENDVKLIMKRELLERMKQIEATVNEQKNKLRQSNKDVTRKERCIQWPICQKPDCQFYHPKALCL